MGFFILNTVGMEDSKSTVSSIVHSKVVVTTGIWAVLLLRFALCD